MIDSHAFYIKDWQPDGRLDEYECRDLGDVMNLTNMILERSWTHEGVELWWDNERYQLEGKTPNQVVDEQGLIGALTVLELAMAGRESYGA